MFRRLIPHFASVHRSTFRRGARYSARVTAPPVNDPTRDGQSESDALEHARHVLASSREGVLHFGETQINLKFVADGRTGRLIACVPAAVMLASDHTLFVPEESDEALQLMVTPEEAPESEATDRWQAYHVQPEHVRWAELWVESGKHGAWVFDGEALMLPNPLVESEPALCRAVNADKALLAKVCQRHAGVVAPSPTCVGVDPGGLYVRAPFGVVRVWFERPADGGEAARAAYEALARAAG